MKTRRYFIRNETIMALGALVTAAILPLPVLAQEQPAARERIGIYDSRAIAIAYSGSAAQSNQLRQIVAEHRESKAAGDLEKVRRLEAVGQATQKKAHLQAFSTEPIDDLLEHITNALPQIQKEAGVSAIVSKWDKTELARHPGAERVDVTMRMVDAFQPSPRQRQYAIDIQKRKPISREEALRHGH